MAIGASELIAFAGPIVWKKTTADLQRHKSLGKTQSAHITALVELLETDFSILTWFLKYLDKNVKKRKRDGEKRKRATLGPGNELQC